MSRTIVMTGGGSGGHITPILAVAKELKRTDPSIKIVYVGQKGDSLADIPANDPSVDKTYTVLAGKFRRYHGEGFMQLLDIKTMFLNIRDLFYVAIGLFQSWRLMGKLRPDIVFSRGGFVSVPVALGAGLRRIPYITHDSDGTPSLANKLIARWACMHAVAMPIELYPYPATKTVTTGIPLTDHFTPVDNALNNKYRSEIGIGISAKMLFVIGGGLGSQRVNEAVAETLPHLFNDFGDLQVVHIVGRANLKHMQHLYSEALKPESKSRLRVLGFIDDVYRYGGAADVVVTRAGATNLAEFAVQGKACIVIPSPFLAAGHQLRNAEYLEEQGAALILNEEDLADDPNRLAKYIDRLLRDSAERHALEKGLAAFAKPNATTDLAKLILEQANKHETKAN